VSFRPQPEPTPKWHWRTTNPGAFRDAPVTARLLRQGTVTPAAPIPFLGENIKRSDLFGVNGQAVPLGLRLGDASDRSAFSCLAGIGPAGLLPYIKEQT